MRLDEENHLQLMVWRIWVAFLSFLMVAVVSFGVIVVNNGQKDVKQITKQTRELTEDQSRFVDNFSNYMTCLIVNDDKLVIQVGEETYVEICKRLLYRNINPIPPTIKPDLSELSTTTTTQKR